MNYGYKKSLESLINEALESEKKTKQMMLELSNLEHADASEMLAPLKESANIFNEFSKKLVSNYDAINKAGLLDSLKFLHLEEPMREAVSLKSIRDLNDEYEIAADVTGAYVSGDFRDFDLRISVDKNTHEFSSASFAEKMSKTNDRIFCQTSLDNTTGPYIGVLIPVLCDFLEKQTPTKASVLSEQFLSKIVEKNEKMAEELETQLSAIDKLNSKMTEVERSERA